MDYTFYCDLKNDLIDADKEYRTFYLFADDFEGFLEYALTDFPDLRYYAFDYVNEDLKIITRYYVTVSARGLRILQNKFSQMFVSYDSNMKNLDKVFENVCSSLDLKYETLFKNKRRLTYKENNGKFGVIGMNKENEQHKVYDCISKLVSYEELVSSPDDLRTFLYIFI